MQRFGMTARFVLIDVCPVMAQCIRGHALGTAPPFAPEPWSLA